MPALVLTRSQEDNEDLISDYSSNGLDLYSFPCLDFAEPVDGYKALDQAIRNNHHYDWIFFLSKKSVESFFERLLALGGHFFHLSPRLKIACVGDSTRDFVVNEIGFPVDFVPTKFNAESLADEFLQCYASLDFLPGMDRKKILIPRNEDIDDGLSEILQTSQEFQLDICPAYKTIEHVPNLQKLEEFKSLINNSSELFISFASSKTVENFAKYINEADLHSGVRLMSIGPKTTVTIKALFPNLPFIEANKPSFEAMFEELAVLES